MLSHLGGHGRQPHDGFGVVAGDEMSGADELQYRRGGAAMGIGVETALGVGATGRPEGLRGNRLRSAALPATARAHPRHSFQQGARIGMRAAAE